MISCGKSFIMQIEILPSHKIDKQKWDDCIKNSCNPLIYATSVYLDCMADNWDGLILNDYEAVMPLPWRKKYFIKYIYTPAFTQQLGIFSNFSLNENIINIFLKNIPGDFKYIEINCHSGMKMLNWLVQNGKNYLLDILGSYEEIKKNYSRSAIRNINKAKTSNVSIRTDVNSNLIIQLHQKRFSNNIGVTQKDYNKFSLLANALKSANACYTFGAFMQQQLIAGSIYFLYKNRVVFIFNGNSKESLVNGATHLLKDEAIKFFANKVEYMDFEGSNNPDFARFYQQYGAKNYEVYSKIWINRLPKLLQLFKR